MRPFSVSQKVLIAGGVFVVLAVLFFSGSAAGRYLTNVTLRTNADLANGLVGYWTLDGQDITTSIQDKSGQGKHGYWVSASTGGGSTPPFNDDFEDASIDSGWTTPERDPLGHCTTSESGGDISIAIETAGIHDLFSSDENACVFYQDLSSDPGDFIVTLEISALPGDDQITGLVVGDTNLSANETVDWVTIEFFGSAGNLDVYRQSFDGTNDGNTSLQSNLGYTAPIYLRIQRSTNDWTTSYSDDGSSWNTLGTTFTKSFTVDKIGFWAGTSISTTFTGTFENFSGDTFNAQSGSQAATATTTAKTLGRIGQAMNFDGNSDYIDIGNAGSGIKTIAFWIKADDISSRKIMDIDGADQIEINASSEITATSFPGTTSIYVDGSSASAVVTTGWHHVTITDTTGVNASAFQIGRVSTEYFDGIIDDIRVYNRALSASEVGRLYDLGATTHINKTITTNTAIKDGLLGHWTFDGPDITTSIQDKSGQGNNGYWNSENAATDITRVQSAIGIGDPGSATFGVTPTEGNLLLVFASERSGTLHENYTISGSGWTKILGRDVLPGDTTYRRSIALWYKVAGSSEPTQIDVDDGTTNAKRIMIQEFTSSEGGTFSLAASTSTDNGATTGDRVISTGTTTVSTSGEQLVTGYVMRKEGASESINPTTWTDGLSDVIYADPVDGSSMAMVSAYVDTTSSGVKESTATVPINAARGLVGALTVFEVNATDTSTTTAKTAGRIGQAMNFDGNNDYINIGDVGSGIKTIAFWIKADDNTSRKIISLDGTDHIEISGSTNITATSFPGTTVIYVDGSSASQAVTTGWHHVVVTDTTGVDASTFEIGRVGSGYFDGLIDDVRIYNKVLSANERDQLYQLGSTSRINRTIPINLGLNSVLVGHWSFDGPTMFSNVQDISGQANHGKLLGQSATTTAIGRTGQALEFDGTDDYVSVGTSYNGVKTVMFWMNPDTTTEKIIDLNGSAYIEISAGEVLATGFTEPTIFVDGAITSSISTGWHHITVTSDTAINASAVDIGRISSGYFDGVLDDVRFYTSALSTSDIARLYNFSSHSATSAATRSTIFPLVINGRNLETQSGTPFTLNGDTPWSLAAQLSPSEVETYLDNRQAKGVNALIMNAIEHKFADSAPNNYNGDSPFTGTTGGEEDFTTPRAAYWNHVEFVADEAEERGIVLFMLPAYVGFGHGNEGWAAEVNANGDANMQAYGEWLAGTQFADNHNIIWVMGGDADTVETFDLTSEYNSLAQGILNGNSGAIITAHSKPGSSSIDDYNQSWLDMNWVYKYPGEAESQAQVIKTNYEATDGVGETAMPSYWGEGWYENEHSATGVQLRSQIYYPLLGGANAGHFYGGCPLWHFDATAGDSFCDSSTSPFDVWTNAVDSTISSDLQWVDSLMDTYDFSLLEPDYTSTVVTGGRGDLDMSPTTWAAAAKASDSSFIMAYTPDQRQLTVDMTELSGTADAEWFNPQTGATTSIGTGFSNTGTQSWTPPSSGDWILIVKVQ